MMSAKLMFKRHLDHPLVAKRIHKVTHMHDEIGNNFIFIALFK